MVVPNHHHDVVGTSVAICYSHDRRFNTQRRQQQHLLSSTNLNSTRVVVLFYTRTWLEPSSSPSCSSFQRRVKPFISHIQIVQKQITLLLIQNLFSQIIQLNQPINQFRFPLKVYRRMRRRRFDQII